MKLSENFTLDEFIYSPTAIKHGIDNTPSPEHIENIKALVTNVVQPVRHFLRQPLKISSGYRHPELNARIGGAHKIVNGKKVATSQHCKGEAVDLNVTGRNAEIFRYIKANLEFDQIIWEFGTDSEPAWVHVSYAKKNRKKMLKAVKEGGKTVYKKL
jgi:zinc D-Ala-D-Ala carboxypeptidase